MNRRTLLAATAAMAIPRASAFARAIDEPAIVDEDPKQIEALRAFLAKSDIRLGAGTKTRHYLVFDDNPPEHRFDVRRFCEALMADAIDVFEHAGLEPRSVARRLSVVVLDQEIYDRLANQVGAGAVGSHGMYNRNLRAVIAQLARKADDPSGPIDWAPTVRNLGHELIHQITYSVGLLNPTSVPSVIGEGLAMLGEVSSWTAPRLLKQTNLDRLERLPEVERRGPIPLAELFRNDDLLMGKALPWERRLDAYSWSWLLVYTLLTEEDLRPKFRAFLRAIVARDDKTHRVEDARRHLGDLDALQDRLVRRMHRLISRPPSRYTSTRRLPARP